MSTEETPSPTPPPPRRRRRLLLVLGSAALLLLVFFGVWLFSPVHIDEPVPGTVKTQGVVAVEREGAAPSLVRNLGTVRPGDTVRVEEGNAGFLFLQGGVLVRLEGPSAVKLAESRRQVDAPSVLQGLLGQRTGATSLGKTHINTTLALEVLSGAVAIRAKGIDANAPFTVRAANVYSRLQGATVQVTVRPEGEVWWDTLEGAPTFGMVSGPPGQEAPVVIPAAALGLRVVTPLPGLDIQATESYQRLFTSMRELVDSFVKGTPDFKAGGVDYQEFTDSSGLVYLTSATVTATETQETFTAEESDAPPAEEVVSVPGVEVRLLTDADIQAQLPPGFAVHLLPGNVLRLTVGGVPYTVRATIIAGRLEMQGLPLGIDPTAYAPDIPALLSIETDEGVARVSYLPEEAPPPLREGVSKEIRDEGALPHSAPYFSAIPTPLQVSLDWNVAASNILLVALLALILRMSVASSTNILGGYEANLKRHLDPLLRIWRPLATAVAAFFHRVPHLLTTVAGNAVVLLAVNGALFAFLDVRFRPWEGTGLQVFPLMLLGVAAAGMVDPVVRARVLSRWKAPHSFGLNPANLFLGVVAVATSRGLHLAPGLLLGSAGGLRSPTVKDMPLKQKSSLIATGLIGTAAVGLGAWLVTLLLPLAASAPLSAGLFLLLRGPLGAFQDICLLAFVGCLTKVFFSLLPVPNSPSLPIVAAYRVRWVLAFVLTGFLYFHLILNKNTGITKLLQERGALLTTLVVVSLLATLALYVFSRVVAKRAAMAKP